MPCRFNPGLMFRFVLAASAVLLVMEGTCQDASAAPPEDDAAVADEVSAADAEFFTQRVQPLLEQHCFECHGAKADVKGGLRLSNRDDILRGGDSGPAMDLEDPESSLLLSAINYETFEMPPKGKLPDEQRAVFAEWVRRGGHFAPGTEQRVDEARHEPRVTEEAKRFWSFQPVNKPNVPDVASAWVQSPIDAFILQRLEQEQLVPAVRADKLTLLRRATYDLLGLPPTDEQIQTFLADDSPDAFARLVDRLLDSPHYGERWGRHWLDLVRYAETNSFERDGAKPHVWKYRDYVIRALNDDMPYDQFVLEQLAGDELPEVTPDSIIATGYYRLGPWDDEPSDPEQALYDDLDDILSTTSQVFLGLTINCARCHNHKLDPIPQADYYRMLAFFRNVRRYGVRAHETVLDASVRTIASPEEQQRHREQMEQYQARLAAIDQQLAEIEAIVRPTFSDVDHEEFKRRENRVRLIRQRVPGTLTAEQAEQYARLHDERLDMERHPPAGLDAALCVKEWGPEAPETFVLIRGNPHVRGDEVEPGFPQVLSPPEPEITPRAESSGRRLALARWIVSPDNPLTARVMVNRVWQYHFGRGLVRSPNNFGANGDPPTHPELLDWLAATFVEDGWSLKKLHRRIMLSSVYQMSSQAHPEGLARDPENLWFWRFDMRRLTAEEIRDAILAVNGSLNLSRMGGPSFYPRLPEEVLHSQSQPGLGWGKSPPDELARRSIYAHVKRSLLTPILVRFDAADPDTSCPVRFVTTQPTQALTMMNSELMQREARTFAEMVRREVGDDPAEQVALALRRVYQRSPSVVQVARGVELMNELRAQGLSPEQALQNFCLVALNLNEFIYLD